MAQPAGEDQHDAKRSAVEQSGRATDDALDRPHSTATCSSASALSANEDPFPEGGKSAWLVVLASFVLYFGEHLMSAVEQVFAVTKTLTNSSCTTLVVGFGFQNAFGVFQTYYTNERAEGPLSTPSRISWIGSFQVFATFASGTVTGILIDRLDARVSQDGAPRSCAMSAKLTFCCPPPTTLTCSS